MQTPGPGTYNTTDPASYKDKAPHYSMTSRNVMPGDTTQKPGPGAHSPENVSPCALLVDRQTLQNLCFVLTMLHTISTCVMMSIGFSYNSCDRCIGKHPTSLLF